MKSSKSPLYEYLQEWSADTYSNIYETLKNVSFPIAMERNNVNKITFAEMLQFGVMNGIHFEMYSEPISCSYSVMIYYKESSGVFENFQSFYEMTEYAVNKICEIIKDNQL